MNRDELYNVLDALRNGESSVADVMDTLSRSGIDPLNFAHVDVDLARRCGLPEVVFGPGKTADQMSEIVKSLYDARSIRDPRGPGYCVQGDRVGPAYRPSLRLCCTVFVFDSSTSGI